jgi:hypothetical protein
MPTIGLCDVGEFENRPPGTAAQFKNKCTNKVQKMIEKLLPEPQPNSEPMMMGIASAPILQNPLLSARASTRQSSFQSFSSYIKFSILQKSRRNEFYNLSSRKTNL